MTARAILEAEYRRPEYRRHPGEVTIWCRDGNVTYWPEGTGYVIRSSIQRQRWYPGPERGGIVRQMVQELGGER